MTAQAGLVERTKACMLDCAPLCSRFGAPGVAGELIRQYSQPWAGVFVGTIFSASRATIRAIVMLCIVGLLTVSSWRAADAQDTAAQLPAAPNPRIALVIGNGAYADHPLATTANDAGLVAQTLQAAGFDVVGARDVDEKSLREALRDFVDKAASAGPDGLDFIYLAGRGVQYEGDNYFVPVDARIVRDADVPIQAVKISDFTHALAAIPGRSHIVVLDAARANDFAPQASPLAAGLALVDPDPNTLLAFNAAPGTVAPDEPAPYGVYGKDLAGLMRQGGTPIDEVFAQARLKVNQDTGGSVVPWSASKLQSPLFLFDRAPDAPSAPAVVAAVNNANRPLRSFGPQDAYAAALMRDTMAGYEEFLAAYPDSAQAPRIRAILAARREALFWRRSVQQNTPRAYWTYLRRYPNGPHVADAQRRLAILAATEAPPTDFAPVDYSDLPPPPPDEGFYAEAPVAYFGDPELGPPPPPPPADFVPEFDSDWNDLPPPPPPAAYGYLPVLSFAIPLVAGAMVVSYQHMHSDRDGVGAIGEQSPMGPTRPLGPRAPAAASRPQGVVPAPQLPTGVVPKPPPAATASVVKPIPLPGTQGGRPVSTAPNAVVKPLVVPAPSAGATKPLIQPSAAPTTPAGAAKPLPAEAPLPKPTAPPITRTPPKALPAATAPTPTVPQTTNPAVDVKPGVAQPTVPQALPAGAAKPLPPTAAPSIPLAPASAAPTTPNAPQRPSALPSPISPSSNSTLTPKPAIAPAPDAAPTPTTSIPTKPASQPTPAAPAAGSKPLLPPSVPQKPASTAPIPSAPPQPAVQKPPAGPAHPPGPGPAPIARPIAPAPLPTATKLPAAPPKPSLQPAAPATVPTAPPSPPAQKLAPPPQTSGPPPSPKPQAVPRQPPPSGHPPPACGGPQQPHCPK
jgi:uncharacterized caspase-like protein